MNASFSLVEASASLSTDSVRLIQSSAIAVVSTACASFSALGPPSLQLARTTGPLLVAESATPP